MWYECLAKRAANETFTCLYKKILSLPSEIEEITFYSDLCGGQDKNSHVAAMFLIVMASGKLKQIDHKHMIVGHTHMEVGTDHSLIERKKKQRSVPIYLPHDRYQLIRLTLK